MNKRKTASADLFSRANTAAQTKLEASRAELARLLSAYSANHPDVLRLEKDVEKLEKQAATASRAYGQSGEKALRRFTFRIDNKDLQFAKQQDLNRAIVNIYGKISGTDDRVYSEWEDAIAAEYTDPLLETGKTKQTEYQKIVVLPPGCKFQTEFVVTDANSNRTGIRKFDPFERMERYFGNVEGR